MNKTQKLIYPFVETALKPTDAFTMSIEVMLLFNY